MSSRPAETCDVVVMAAMPRELRPLVRALRLHASPLFGLPAWRGRGVVAVVVGVGAARAGTGAAQVLDGLAPRKLLVTGVAGAVDPALVVGDLVRPAAVVDAGTKTTFAPCTSDTRVGVLVTVEGVGVGVGVGSPSPLDGATAVDMETAAIVAAAEARGVPWDVVRAISDTAGALTAGVAAILRPDGRADLRAAARLVAREPRSVLRLVRLGLDSARATRAATRAVVIELAAEERARQQHAGGT
ncbi:MAG TPA: hypothetical protein VND62_05830 [Acidimicrobiales bacterium]|nr:hypothetical protein [Acidimicrobiales bacterium]